MRRHPASLNNVAGAVVVHAEGKHRIRPSEEPRKVQG
jgi:hypothetical protein